MASIYYSGPETRRRYWTFDTTAEKFIPLSKAEATKATKSIWNRLHKKPSAAAVRQALRQNSDADLVAPARRKEDRQ